MKDKRESYWNETYARYWRERTDESAPFTSCEDVRPPAIAVFERYLSSLKLKSGNSLLEVGIGFGRLIPVFAKAGLRIYGIDISEAMIREVRTNFGDACIELRCAEAEKIPYPDNFFDAVVCWAVFDALYQERALVEMVRVLKDGGRLLLSGKNDDYYDDDRAAYEAEVNARGKGHPNYFTDYDRLSEVMARLGLRSELTHFFERRNDMQSDRFLENRPNRFYEYIIAAHKIQSAKPDAIIPISSEYSRTFKRLALSKGDR